MTRPDLLVRQGRRTPGTTDPAGSPGLILAATVSAAMLVVANVSSLNVALPELSRALEASQTDVHWMVDIYAVFLAALLLLAGAIGDRFGRRLILLCGLGVLTASNLVVLAMDSAEPVIVARGVSGIGAAFIFPATLSTITATLPVDQRARGVAMWTASVSVGGILGILGSGLLIETFWWGSVFLGMAIASVAVLVSCWMFVPDSSDPEEVNLDPVGALLSFLAVGALVLGVVEGPVEGWDSAVALTGLVGGSAALIGFVFWEWRNPRPLLDVRLFAERGIRSGALSIFVQFTAAFGFFFVTVFYLAFVLGYGPLDTGLGLLPVAIGILPASAVAIPLTRRFGRATMGVIGLTVLASAFFVGLLISVDSSFWLFGLVMVIFGTGIGLSSPPATEAIVESLPSSKQGVASALNDVLREFGAAIGIAVVGAAFNSGYRSTVADFSGFPDDVVDAVRDTPAAAAVIAPDLGEAGESLIAQVSRAVVDGWHQSMWVVGSIVVVGAVGYLWWAPRESSLDGSRADVPAPRGQPGQMVSATARGETPGANASGAGHPILVGVDGSPGSWTALTTAADLAKTRDTHLVVCFVDHHSAVVEYAPEALAADREATATIERTIRERLTNLPSPPELHIRGPGRPGHELAQLGRDLDVEMIVVGAGGHGIATARELGSTVHELLSHADKAVLVVRD